MNEPKKSDKPVVDNDKIVEIPLSSIVADFEWNCRKLVGEKEENTGGEGAESEFESLMNSIDQKGQRDAVTVRPKGNKYFLVVGFRRFAAITKLAEKNGNKSPTIRAIVKQLDDIQAREENLGENVSRKQIDPTGLCKGLVDLKGLYLAAKKEVTVTALADRIGINRPYASMLNTIAEKLKPELLQKWYDAPAIGVNRALEVARAKEELQDELWEKRAATGGRGNKSDAVYMEQAISKCEKLGALLGSLEGKKLISTEGLDFKRDMEKLDVLPKDVTPAQRKDLVHAITDAFEEAMQLILNPPAPEEKKAKKGKKADAAAEADAN